MANLNGRRVLVTGASSGIGAATVRAVAQAGAHVACLARRADRLAALAQETGAVALPVDLTDGDAARAAVDRAANELGGLDGVVNNAGSMRLSSVTDGRREDWKAMLDLNVLALLDVTQASLPHLRAAGGGDIVNVSSMAGRRVPSVAGAVYSATKFAVHAISEGLRRELHREGIRIVVVSPGTVATELGADNADEGVRTSLRRRQEEIGIDAADIGRQIAHALAEPRHVMLYEIALLPTAQD